MEQSEQTPKLVKVSRLDSIPVNEAYFTDEGYLIDCPVVTSVGIFEYKNPDGSKRRELRLPEHVFAEESLKTYKGKPVIITHNAGMIDKNNTDEIIGTILSDGYRDGDNVRAEIIIHDTKDMEKSKLRELSLGYDLDIDETPGVWNGQPYDAIQTNIKINHLALVGTARAGGQARLNLDGETENNIENSKGENQKMEETAKIGENPAAASEENGQTAEEKLNFIKDRKDRRDSEGIEKTQSDEDIDALLEMLEQLQAQNDLNQAKQDSAITETSGDATVETTGEPNGGTEITIRADSIDNIVAERIRLGRLGDKLNLDVYGMKPQEAKKAIIKNRFPAVRLDGKSDGYIDAMFKDVASEINTKKDTNYQRRQMAQGRKDAADFVHSKSGAEIAREKMADKILNGGNE